MNLDKIPFHEFFLLSSQKVFGKRKLKILANTGFIDVLNIFNYSRNAYLNFPHCKAKAGGAVSLNATFVPSAHNYQLTVSMDQ